LGEGQGAHRAPGVGCGHLRETGLHNMQAGFEAHFSILTDAKCGLRPFGNNLRYANTHDKI